MRKYIYSLMALLTAGLCPAQLSAISQAEYFWDTDPGEGNGTAIVAADQNYNSAFERIAVYGIGAPAAGLHKFSVRVKDNLGAWSPVFTQVVAVQATTAPTPLSLTQAEYFWDTDPGEGNGIPLLAADQDFNSAFEKVMVYGLNAPGTGLHQFSARVKDNQGTWSPVFTQVVAVEATTTPVPMAVSQAEYFWDTDPGEGNGIPFLAADQNFNSAFENLKDIAIPIVNPIGLHLFNVRVKDNQGVWGPVFKNAIYIESALSLDAHSLADNYYFVPNPASSVIRFNKNIQKVEITDLNGRMVATVATAEINISGLASGTYILNITTPEGEVLRKKMIKQ